MRDVSFWNYAKTQPTIAAEFTSGIPDNAPGLVAYWPLSDGVNPTADLSSGNRPATLHAGAVFDKETYSVTTTEGDYYALGYNGMEEDDEVKGEGNSYDFGARLLDPRLGRWLSIDKLAHDYPHQSPYAYSSNSPIYKIDIGGDWDVTIHACSDRGKMGYGIAVVTSDAGEVIGEYLVRLCGTAGEAARKSGKTDKNLRTITNGDTPTGVYKIGGWLNSTDDDQKNAYGPNKRMVLTGEEGEIMDCSPGATGRQGTIRMHGGRQERGKTGNFDPDNVLKYTNGCIRIADEDVLEIYNLTEKLKQDFPDEKDGQLTIKDDLQLVGTQYYTPDVAKEVNSAYYFIKWADKRMAKGKTLNSKQNWRLIKSYATMLSTSSVNDKVKDAKNE